MKTTHLASLTVALAATLALLPGTGCTGDDSSDSDSGASTSTSTTGEGAAIAELCAELCARPAPAAVCAEAPSGCVDTCAALGSASCLTCRIDQLDLGWAGMMTCGFTPCSFSDAAGYDACAANCDPETATCELVLDDEVAEACAEACGP